MNNNYKHNNRFKKSLGINSVQRSAFEYRRIGRYSMFCSRVLYHIAINGVNTIQVLYNKRNG
jgi:hypothetical protein